MNATKLLYTSQYQAGSDKGQDTLDKTNKNADNKNTIEMFV